MKNLKKELSPLHSKMENMITSLWTKSISYFFSDKYDDVLNQIKKWNEKVQQQKIELGEVDVEANNP